MNNQYSYDEQYLVAEKHSGYSIDKMKRAAFVDELNNVLILEQDCVTINEIKKYLESRIKEIDEKYQ